MGCESVAGSGAVGLDFHNAEDRRLDLPIGHFLIYVTIESHEFRGFTDVDGRAGEPDSQMSSGMFGREREG